MAPTWVALLGFVVAAALTTCLLLASTDGQHRTIVLQQLSLNHGNDSSNSAQSSEVSTLFRRGEEHRSDDHADDAVMGTTTDLSSYPPPPLANSTKVPSAWNASAILRCMSRGTQRINGVRNVHLIGISDSHGRGMLASICNRLELAKPPQQQRVNVTEFVVARRHGVWSLDAITSNEWNVRVGNIYSHDGQVKRASSLLREVTSRGGPTRVHLVLSRGAWDAEHYSTSLQEVYSQVQNALRRARSWPRVASVTVRLLHPLVAWGSMRMQWACRRDRYIQGYRRVVACATARYIRTRSTAANASGTPPHSRGNAATAAVVRVLDAWDLVKQSQRWPSRSYTSDGMHLRSPWGDMVGDALLEATMCPSDNRARTVEGRDGMWWSSDAAAIEARFQCDRWFPLAVDGSVPSTPAARGVLAQGPWDKAFNTATRPECTCSLLQGAGVNDHCALRSAWMLRAGGSATIVYDHLCGVLARVTAKDDSWRWRTNISEAIIARIESDLLGKSVVAACADPSRGVTALRDVGAGAPVWDASAPVSCSNNGSTSTNNASAKALCLAHETLSQRLTADLVQLQLRYERKQRTELTMTCTDPYFWKVALNLVCDKAWLGEGFGRFSKAVSRVRNLYSGVDPRLGLLEKLSRRA